LEPFGGTCSEPVGFRGLSLTLPNGTAIGDNTTLFLAIPDFLVDGGDGYDMFFDSEKIIGSDSGLDQFSLVEAAVESLGTIHPVVEGRILEA